jgi:lipoprotein-releasing system ATP-binding protein
VRKPGISLEVRNLEREFVTPRQRLQVLRGITFDLAAGDAIAITGPSGSGKSTLLQILGTLDEPTGGEIRISGQQPFDLSEPELARFRNQHIGFVFQDHHLLPQYSALENVLIPTLAGTSKSSGSNTQERALHLLERVQLGHRKDHRPAELSGGERQRVAVARALINNPGLLLCDEPTGSLDQSTAEAVGDLLLDLHGGEPRILVVVTHSLDLAERFTRRMVLRSGEIEESS